MTASPLADLPLLGMLLLKWSALLGIGWSLHALLAKFHTRWRVILWRCVFCFILAMPFLHLRPIYNIEVVERELAAPPHSLEPAKNTALAQTQKAQTPPLSPPHTGADAGIKAIHLPAFKSTQPVSWLPILLVVWALGFFGGAARLIWSQVKLSQLRKASMPTHLSIRKHLQQVQARLEVRRRVDIRLSASTHSPFVCGLLKPVILVPERLANTISSSELSALLAHELAHVRHNDLIWYIGYRWIQTIFWFHPLAWRVPAAHSLACEQEADRIASTACEGRIFYAQTLAQLALRVIALRNPVEHTLALNSTSQIARRLRHLTDRVAGIWTRKRSLAGFALASALFLGTVGWSYSKVKVADPIIPAPNETKDLLIEVRDKEGKPIEGAVIKPYAYRVKGPRFVDHRGWRDRQSRLSAPKITTDREGKAHVTYDVVADPEEKLLTAQISFTVSHPEFAPGTGHFAIDEKNEPVQLERGIRLTVSGYFGANRIRVPEIVAFIGEDPGPNKEDWTTKEPGVLEVSRLPQGANMVQLMGRLASGEIVYSEAKPFVAEKGQSYRFDMEMKQGIRLEGRIDDKVLRPVKNGRAVITVRPKEYPTSTIPEDLGDIAAKYGRFHLWTSYRPIAEDGTFIFESIPFGEVDVVVHGDGFVSENGGVAQNKNSGQPSGLVIGIPQAFPLTAPTTSIEVVTEPSVTLEVMAKTKWGKPIKGAAVHVNPNLMRIRTGLFGQVRRESDESHFRKVEPLPLLMYFAETDENGKAVLANVPAITRNLTIFHPEYEIPLPEPHGHRDVDLKLTPGETKKLTVRLQPKGNEFIGTEE